MTVTVPAYAKINLFLDIVSRRADKYHNILSYMQSVSLHDKVTVAYEKSNEKTIEIICDHPSVPTGNDNLIWKAANAFPIVGKIQVHLVKNIPMSAGLAGGSADAAATLVALNRISGSILSTTELKELGARLGADVPFCIEGGAAIVEGIGDILTKERPMPRLPIVVARKGEGMSTPAAYGQLDVKFENFEDYAPNQIALSALLNDNNRSDAKAFCQGLFNIFESVVEPQRKHVSEIKSILKEYGAAGAIMSGSGTSVFGIFENEDDAQAAKNRLLMEGAKAFLCYPIE